MLFSFSFFLLPHSWNRFVSIITLFWSFPFENFCRPFQVHSWENYYQWPVCLSVCLSIHVLHASLKLRSVYNASLCLCLTKYDSHYPVSLVLCMSSTFVVVVFFCSSCACFFYQNFLRFFFFCSIMALEFSFSLCGDHSWWVMIMKIKKKQQKIIQMW